LTNSDGLITTYPTRGGNIVQAATAINGFTNSVEFQNNLALSFAYKTFTAVPTTTYVFSCFVQMNDNSVPNPGANVGSADFSIIISGEVATNLNVQSTATSNVYRVSGTFTAINTVANHGVLKYTTQSAKGFKVTGYQLEIGDVATAYIPTTTAAVSVGPVANVPRLDYLGSSCPRLLLEPQRSNLITFSEQFNQWTASSATVTANYAVSPDGYTNADRVVFAAGGLLYNGATGSAGQNTLSVYAKATNGVSGQFRFFGNGNTTLSTNQTATGEWQRFTFTYTYSAVTAGLAAPTTGGGVSDVIFYGFQHEIGAYATSYIPTLAASATRGEDFYAKAGFGNVSTAGTLYYEFQNYQSPAAANGLYMVCLFAGSAVTSTAYSPAESISIINNGVTVQGRNDGLATTLFSITPALNATVKVALRYDGTNVVAFVNGVKGTVFSDTAVGAKNAIRVNNGENATHATKQLLFFPSALTDAQLIELTTL
jgi:hypothetical protein